MNNLFRWLPEQASAVAGQVDGFYLALIVLGVFVTMLTTVLVVVFALLARRRSGPQAAVPPPQNSKIELLCGSVLLLLVLAICGRGAKLYLDHHRVPADAMEILVVGRQWTWKFQHPQGKREINELHVPVGQPVQLNMTSEDVLHPFSIPAFRLRQDAVPGRYTKSWFEATKVGRYPILCTGYVGAEHSRMDGYVYAMPPADYERWLRGASAAAETPVEAGARIFNQLGCATCHNAGPTQLGPSLNGIYGHRAKMADGSEVLVDDEYLRESILNAPAKIAAGYQPVMPLFKDMISEDQLLNLIAYIKSLTPPGASAK